MPKQIIKKILGKITQKEIPLQKEKEDEFINWLRFAVPGMTGLGNQRAFEYVAQNLDSNAPIIEIGSFCGLSTIMICHFLSKYGRSNKVITCDKLEFENKKLGNELGDSKFLTHDIYKKFVKESYIRNINTFTYSNIPFTIEAFSDEFFNFWSFETKTPDILGREIQLGGDISFAFIDGNHTYEFSKRDFENSDKYLVSGGYILFDDSADASDWEVNKLARDVVKSSRYELIAKNPNYLLRKK